MAHPQQFTTAEGTIQGTVNGINRTFRWKPYDTVLIYGDRPGGTPLLFEEGVLIEAPRDYIEGSQYFEFPAAPTGLYTARVFDDGGGPTRLKVNRGVLEVVPSGLAIVLTPGHSENIPFLFFNNGLLLTLGVDYLYQDPWILPEGGIGDVTIVISMGGITCSTSTAGGIPIPPNVENFLFFRNGVQQTLGADFFVSGDVIILNPGTVMVPGDTYGILGVLSGGHSSIVSSFDGTITGAIDGSNHFFNLPGSPVFAMLFYNGIFMTPDLDYTRVNGLVDFVVSPLAGSILTALIFGVGVGENDTTGNGGISGAVDGTNRTFSVSNANWSSLFRNGIFQVPNVDYVPTGALISMVYPPVLGDALAAETLPAKATPTAATPLSPTPFLPLITGDIDGFNTVFFLPFSPRRTMLWHNGELQTEGLGYIQDGAMITLPGAPQPGDILTAQIWAIGGPDQVTTFDKTLDYAVSAGSWVFRNEVFQAQPGGAVSSGDQAVYTMAPFAGNIVTIEAWTPNITDPFEPALNLAKQFQSADGSLIGPLNGANNSFMLNTTSVVFQVALFWKGGNLIEGFDFTWDTSQPSSVGAWVTVITMINGNIPDAGDALVAQVWA